MPPPNYSQRKSSLQEQNDKRILETENHNLKAQIQALLIQLNAVQADTERAVQDAVAQSSAIKDNKYNRLMTRCVNENLTATQTIQTITAEKTALEEQVEELRRRLEQLENAPAPADAMAVDGQMRECSICRVDSDASKMLSCGGDHRMCSECFGTWLDGKINTGCVDPVTCQGLFTQAIAGQCVHAFSNANLVRVVGGEKVLTWFVLKMDVKDEQVAMAQKQLRESVFKIVESVEEAREHIITQILTTKCPKPGCGKVFLEFEGCAALICSNPNCSVVGDQDNPRRQTNFCAWCGKAWGNSDEMHRHIIYCSMNPSPGQYYPNYGMNTYLSVLRKRQRGDIMQYLRAQQESVGLDMIRQILVACQQDISQCGIEEIDYFRL